MQCVYAAKAFIVRDTRGDTTRTTATNTADSTVTVLVVENKRQSLVADGLPNPVGSPQEYVFTIVDTFDRIQLLCFQREISLSNTTKSELELFIKVLTSIDYLLAMHVRG